MPRFPAAGSPAARILKILCTLLIVPGAVVFLIGALREGQLRVWQIYLVNLIFWSGFAQAGVVVSALIHTTNGKWGRNVQHIMEGLTLFSFPAFILFLLLYIGADVIFPWVRDPIPEKGLWLNIVHMFVRENVNLVVINILNLIFLYFSFRPDVGRMVESGDERIGRLLRSIALNWQGFEAESERRRRVLRRISPVILFVYAITYSILAFDLVMSLDPHWYSTLFGAYYFMTNLYLGIAGITIVTIVTCAAFRLDGYVTAAHRRDLGLMLFVFCLIALDFFWSQYLVIWYGNIPEETSFVVERINRPEWLPWSLTVLAGCFVLPFLLLLSRASKERPYLLLPIACLVFAGMWLERYLLVVPTVWHEDPPLGFPEFAVTLAFLAGFVLVYVMFLERFPALPCDAEPAVVRGAGHRAKENLADSGASA
jgi:hypothetical protein